MKELPDNPVADLDDLIQRMCHEPGKSPLEEMMIDALMTIADALREKAQV